jgi:hypothetical protein
LAQITKVDHLPPAAANARCSVCSSDLVDQDRIGPPELDHRGRDLIHLSVAVRARVALVRSQAVDRPQLDPVGERNQGRCGARLCFQSQGCDAMLEQAGNIASHPMLRREFHA